MKLGENLTSDQQLTKAFYQHTFDNHEYTIL